MDIKYVATTLPMGEEDTSYVVISCCSLNKLNAGLKK